MLALKLKIAFSDNPRIDPLRDGTVKPENIELDFAPIADGGGGLFQRNLTYDEFDVSEMSISESLLAIERRGNRAIWDWVKIPVFLSRGHVWGSLYVNTAAGIDTLADFKGKRIATPDYDMTAALWFRITLKDLYGIDPKDNIWYNGRTKELSHGGALGLDKQPPVGIEHHWLTVDQSMDIMLDRGEIDASTAIRPGDPVTVGDPTVIDRHGGTQIEGNPRIKKLLPDNGKGVIYEYRTKTGFFHSNHHVIIQRKIVEESPWVPMELFKAFQRSKLEAYERADKQMSGRSQSDSTILYFEANDFADQAAVLGQDPYPIGLQKMGKNVERAILGSMEQGLLTKQLKLEDVYHHTTLDT